MHVKADTPELNQMNLASVLKAYSACSLLVTMLWIALLSD